MEDFSKNGRKLRPRKTAEGPAYSTSSFRRDGGYSSNRGDNEGRPHSSERRTYGQNRPYGERRNSNSEGERRSYGEHRQYGQSRPYGEHRSNSGEGETRSYGERRQYGQGRSNSSEGRTYGQNRPYGEHRTGNGGQHRSARPQGGRPQFGRKPGFKKNFNSAASEEGINRMISRKPLVTDTNTSDNDYVKTPIQEEVRLNKFIANSGVCSRREADTLIQAGVVTVNGEVVTELGTKVNIYKDEIKFNGEKLKGEEKVYLVMNKPKGYVTTASDPHAEKTVMELLKGCTYRVFPVGRLDKNTTGVLMFTNDGELAEKLTHPSYDKKKIYQVSLDKPLQEEDRDKILAGIDLTDGRIAADELEYIDADDHRKLGIEIHSGKNRIVRRIFEALGYEVKALDRVYFAGLTKKGLKKGEWRRLSEGEVNILRMGAYV